MNAQNGTVGAAAVGQAQRPIHVCINDSWDMLHALSGRITELEDRLIPVVTPLCDKTEGPREDKEPCLAVSPVTGVFDEQTMFVQCLRDRLDSVLARLEV